MPNIADARILIIATHGFEQSELEVPRDKLRAQGATVDVATLDGNAIKGWDQDDWGDEAPADLRIADARAEDYDALVIPGGQINPDLLRVEKDVITLVQKFHDTGKVVAAICHAPWVLIEAGIVSGRKMTAYKSIRTDLRNASAIVEDVAVVADQGIVTSRNPGDLDDFVAKIVEEIEEGEHARKAA